MGCKIALKLLLIVGITQAAVSVQAQIDLEFELWKAIGARDAARVKHLLDVGAEPNSKLTRPPLFQALDGVGDDDSIAIIRMLVGAGADVSAPDSRGTFPLHYAVGNLEACELLLRHGAKVNVQTAYRGTPLHYAAVACRTDVVKLLLKHGAELEAKTQAPPPTPPTPYPWADAAKTSPEARAFFEQLEEDSRRAAKRREREFVRRTEPDYAAIGRTPLICVIASISYPENSDKMITFLLDQGAKVDGVDSVGRTALHECGYYAHSGTLSAAQILIRRGANINARTRNGYTPLHTTVNSDAMPWGMSRVPLAKLLIDHGADVNARTNEGLTPLALLYRSRLDWRESIENMRPAHRDKDKILNEYEVHFRDLEAFLKKHGAKAK